MTEKQIRCARRPTGRRPACPKRQPGHGSEGARSV